MKIDDKLFCIKTKKNFFFKNKIYNIELIESNKSKIGKDYTFIGIQNEYDHTIMRFAEKYDGDDLVYMWKDWILKDHFCTLKEARKYKLTKILENE